MRIVSDGWFREVPSGDTSRGMVNMRVWRKRQANKSTRRLGKALIREGMTA